MKDTYGRWITVLYLLVALIGICLLRVQSWLTDQMEHSIELSKQISNSQIRIADLETVVTKLHKTVMFQQESLERQGNVNTSLMNITEQLVKERNVR